MSDDKRPAGDSASPDAVPSLTIDLNFVPDWARQPPAPDPYAGRDRPDSAPGEDRDRRRGGRERSPRRDGRMGHDRERKGGPPRSRDRDASPPRGGPRPSGRGGRTREERPPARYERPEPMPAIPLQVTFLPDQERLSAMAMDIRAAQHAFPLPELAHLFLTHPEWHLVKFESNRVKGGAYAMEFYLSRISGRLFLDREACVKDTLDTALASHFEAERIQKDPPSGNFVCVGRCRLSGVLLGPPNHHAFNEQVELLHRTRFAHLSIDDYRRQVETLRDPEWVERWKEEWRTVTVYRLKQEEEAALEPMEESQARAYAMEHLVPRNVATVHRAVLTGTVSREIKDPRLLPLLRAAWEREQRFPVTLVRALRGAFRRMGLHLFHTKGGAVFVTPIEPKPMDPGRVIPQIRSVLEWLKAHPGASRQDLIHAVLPAAGDDPEKMTEILQPLTWLIEKGHVIEFGNYTLATPRDPDRAS